MCWPTCFSISDFLLKFLLVALYLPLAEMSVGKRVHPTVPDTAYSFEEFKTWGVQEHGDEDYGAMLFREAVAEEVEQLYEPPRVHPMDLISLL